MGKYLFTEFLKAYNFDLIFSSPSSFFGDRTLATRRVCFLLFRLFAAPSPVAVVVDGLHSI